MKIEISDLNDLPEVAKKIIATHSGIRIFTFNAPMGAGKTTLIKELCKQIGVVETVSSPTFGLVNEYQSNFGPVYHFDCYRMENAEEAYHIGIEEYLDSNKYCFIEWPEIISYFLPEEDKFATINIFVEQERRTFEF